MDHEPITPSRRFPLAGAVVGAIALAVLPVAFGAGWMMSGVERVEVARAPTAAELDLACTPKIEEAQDELSTAHARMLEAVAADTERDLADLDRRLDELAHGLTETLASVTPVVESMVDLTSEAIREEMSEYTSEILRVRELARVEAMAFEI